MATSWIQLGAAVRSRIIAQWVSPTPPPVFLDMAAHDAAVPYVLVSSVVETEDQVFDDTAQTTTVDFDVTVYSEKIGTSPRAKHLGLVEEADDAVRRWKPTLTNWHAHGIVHTGRTTMTVLEDSFQTVLSYTVVVQRK